MPRVGEPSAHRGYVVAPARLDVPRCRRCLRRVPLLLFVAFVLAPLPIVIGAKPAWVGAPCFEIGPIVGCCILLGWMLVFFTIVRCAVDSRFDVAFDGQHMRYSFRDRERAEAFAADHGTTIAAAPPPPSAADDGPEDGPMLDGDE